MAGSSSPDGAPWKFLFATAIVCFFVLECASAHPPPLLCQRPEKRQVASMARWLFHELDWTVVSATNDTSCEPRGDVTSFADGYPTSSDGALYFYLSNRMGAGVAASNGWDAVLSVSEKAIRSGTCNNMPAMEPNCARATATGVFQQVTDETEKRHAKDIIFSRHAVMRHWPGDHGFVVCVYKFIVRSVKVLTTYGPATVITPEAFWAAPICLEHAPAPEESR